MVMGVAVAVVAALFLVRRRKTGLGDKHSTAKNDIGLGKHPMHARYCASTIVYVHMHDFLFIMTTFSYSSS